MPSETHVSINTSDRTLVDVLEPFDPVFAESAYRINVTYREEAEPRDLTGETLLLKIYDSDGVYNSFTGVIDDAENGKCYFDIANTDIGYTGEKTLAFQIDDSILAKATITVEQLGPITAPTGTIIDWSNYDSYENTGTAGPYRAGTNVNFASNADGSVNINSTASVSYAVGGNTTIDWSTTNVSSLTLAFNSTYTFTNIVAGKTYSLHVDQQAGWGINWPTEVTWVGGTPGPPSFGDNLYFFVAVSGSVVYGYEMN